MKNLLRLIFNSTLGKKYLMALSGAAMFGFVIVHMLGNLLIFPGAEWLNDYAAKLKSIPELLWAARLGLLTAVAVHFATGWQLWMENRAARPEGYLCSPNTGFGSSTASRVMIVSGTVLTAFIIVHIFHFTVHWPNTGYAELHDEHGRHDVFAMVTDAFSKPQVVLFYILGVGALCYPLSHGISAMFQSLGLKTKRHEELIDLLARVASIGLFIGFSLVPAAIAVGFVK